MLGLLIVFAVLAVYTFWDNNRITVAEQDIPIEELPEQLGGFKILQITDLHEKVFGENQKKLIKAINSINYDAIVFTGDMMDGITSTNYKPFYTLLEGIKDKENAWYVPGNADPESYRVGQTIEKGDFVQGMEKRGVTFLETFDSIQVDGASVDFVNFRVSTGNVGVTNGIPRPSYASNKKYLAYQQHLSSSGREDPFLKE